MKKYLIALLTPIVLASCTGKVTSIEGDDLPPEFEDIQIKEENIVVNNETEKKVEKIEEEPVKEAEVLANDISQPEDKNTKLAKCLSSKGAKVYGTSWCGHCQNQKKKFGDSAVKHLDFIDCDNDKQKCIEAGIQGYPTWVIDGEHIPGAKNLNFLANKTGCDY